MDRKCVRIDPFRASYIHSNDSLHSVDRTIEGRQLSKQFKLTITYGSALAALLFPSGSSGKGRYGD